MTDMLDNDSLRRRNRPGLMKSVVNRVQFECVLDHLPQIHVLNDPISERLQWSGNQCLVWWTVRKRISMSSSTMISQSITSFVFVSIHRR
jgi:hypothetical protein